MKSFDPELIQGGVFRSVWKLAWPLALLYTVNGIHGVVDHLLVGWYVQSPASAGNAGIGVAWQIFMVVSVFVASLFHGANVLIARSAGRRDAREVSEIFFTALAGSLVFLVAVVAPLGWMAAPYLIAWLTDEPAVRVHALPYLRVLFACGTPVFLMYLFTGAFNACGDPRVPLLLATLTTFLNVLVSALLIPGVGPLPPLGTLGAALGTVIAPAVSCALALGLIFTRRAIIPPPPHGWRPRPRVLALIASIGVPSGIQGVLLNLGGVAMMAYIARAGQGGPALAAYAIGYAQLFSLVTWVALGLRSASGAVMGQNIGAGQASRGRAAVRTAAMLGLGWSGGIAVVFLLAGRQLLALFGVRDPLTLELGEALLHRLGPAGMALAVTLALTGGIQGAGETRWPMVIAFVSQILVLIGGSHLLYAAGMLSTVRLWDMILFAQMTRVALTVLLFRSRGWSELEFETGTAIRAAVETPRPRMVAE
ncbi:MAG TPA: MATE family efflux transporter [Candidatus Hydrogenedentes bacterium]|nr:MATE family efflux transporter [Candidatus Hydrogenedentota bacterium]